LAKTSGHGNPHWTRDETLLVLDLYFDLNGKTPSKSNKRVQELSSLLRRLPYHSEAARKQTFRNPDGVAFKLQNLKSISTHKGLQNTSALERQIWLEFGSEPRRVKELATAIKNVIAGREELIALPLDDDAEFAEGRVITELHKRRERDPKLRSKLIASRRKNASLRCDMCGTKPISNNPHIMEAQFESHHIIPLSAFQARVTRLSEMALLCASCHRLLHRAIAFTKSWLSIQEAKKICGVGPLEKISQDT